MTKKDKTIATVIAVLTIVLATVAVMILFKIPQKIADRLFLHSDKKVNVYEEEIDIEGLDEPFVIYFVADSHISLCDQRDEEIMEKCKERYKLFMYDSMGADENFSIVMDYVAKQKPDLVIFGGDIADEASYASIDFIKKEIGKLKCPYLFCMGNHDFEYGNEYFSEKAYTEYLARYDEINEVRESLEIRRFDNFTVLLLDDTGNQVCDETISAIEELKSEGKPVILAQHVPFVPNDQDSDLIERTNEFWGGDGGGYSRVLMGRGGINPNEATSKLIGFASEDDSLVKIVLAGHIHFYHKDMMNKNAYQITAQPAFERGIIKLTLY